MAHVRFIEGEEVLEAEEISFFAAYTLRSVEPSWGDQERGRERRESTSRGSCLFSCVPCTHVLCS